MNIETVSDSIASEVPGSSYGRTVGGLIVTSVSSSGVQGSAAGYGPIRHRSSGHAQGGELVRPPGTVQHDFGEVLEEFSHANHKRSHSPVQNEGSSQFQPSHDCGLVC